MVTKAVCCAGCLCPLAPRLALNRDGQTSEPATAEAAHGQPCGGDDWDSQACTAYLSPPFADASAYADVELQSMQMVLLSPGDRVGSILNGTIMSQIFYYGNAAPRKPVKGRQQQKKVS